MKRIRLKDRVGQKFGKMLILHTYRENGRSLASCLCDCSNIKTTRLDGLVSGAVVSCGCVALENSRNLNRSHGKWGSPTYRSWGKMIQRCTNPEEYPDHKGITFTKTWKDFENFYRDMGERPEGCTLDRINGKDGYSKRNCRWASGSIQSRNQKKRLDGNLPKGVSECWKDNKYEGLSVGCTRDYTSVKLQSKIHSEDYMSKVYNFWSYILFPVKVTVNNTDFKELTISDLETLYNKLQEKFPEE